MHRIFIYAVVVLFIVVSNVAIGIEVQYKASGWLLSAFDKAVKSARSPTKPELSKKTIKKLGTGTPTKKKHKKNPREQSDLSSHPKAYVAPKSINSNKKIHKARQVYVVPKPAAISIDSLNSNNVKSLGNASKKSAVGRPYLGVVAGVGIGKIGGKQQLDTTDLAEYDNYHGYLPANNFYSTAVYGINGGYEFIGSSNGLLSLGVGIYQNSNYRGNGQVWLLNEFEGKYHISDYAYKLQSTRFMLETQFAWQFDFEKMKLIPFVSFGAGPSLNFVNSYQETVVDTTIMSEQSEFRSNRNISFAYQLGAGIAYPFNADYDRVFIAYRYVDLGTTQFNTTGVVGSTYQLSVEKNRSNEIYIGYTHLFDF